LAIVKKEALNAKNHPRHSRRSEDPEVSDHTSDNSRLFNWAADYNIIFSHKGID
jgi:hypothetical protein